MTTNAPFDEVFDLDDELLPMLRDAELLAYWGVDLDDEPPSEADLPSTVDTEDETS